ncbi:MAG: hypoxanthine phosphoribosyltransferase [Clostridia bacterium]|nr:hypoxanthine phosphoribosyltransferase [Clostridia bacterium]
MYKDFEKVLVSKEQLAKRISELASELDKEYNGKNPLFIGILKGSVFFTADLLKALTIPCQMEFMAVSSYGKETKSNGEVKLIKDLSVPIEGRHVIIVEDIVDSGNTLSYLKRILLQRNPASIKIITLLDKPDRRKVDLKVEYIGFTIPDEFVVGYGLDYDEDYRTFDEVYILKREVYEK